MYTKNELADLVIEGLAGGAAPDSRKWHRGVVRKRMDGILATAIAKIVQRGIDKGDFSIESTWVRPFDKVYVKYDAGRQQCYIDFPARVISLEHNRGLREVRWMNESVASEAFPIIDGLAQSALSELECSILPEGVFFAAVEGERVYFPGMNYLYAQRKAALRVKMLCGSDGFGNSELLPIPDELCDTIVSRGIEAFDPQKRTPMKTQNDHNPNSI